MKLRLVAMLMLLSAGALAAGGDAWLGLMLGDGKLGGVRIKQVVAGSPAERAGLQAGDEVLTVDDKKVETPQSLSALVRGAGAGHPAHVRLVDGKGHTRTVTVLLEAKPDLGELQHAMIGHAAPPFEPKVLAGPKTGKLGSLKGQVVLVDFFATWCGPCKDAMPQLEALHQKYGGKGLKVIGISTESPEIVAGAAERFHLSYSLASDAEESVSTNYHVFALPTVFVIDRQGVVREVAVADEEATEAAVQAALKAK